MAARYWRKLALLAKIESAYGTDPTPAADANAMLAIDVRLTPIEGQEISRDLLKPFLGHQGMILTGQHATIEFSIELAGSGVAGTAPAWGPLLRACGMAETIVAETSVAYAPISGSFESVTLYYRRDGIQHILLGCRGSWTLDLTPQQIPRVRFRLLGLMGTISDTALGSPTLTGFIKPVEVNKANTTASLHSLTLIMEQLSIDLGNDVQPRLLVGYEGIEIVDRMTVGSVRVEAVLLATKNWISIAKLGTTGALSVVHGLIAGNIVTIAAPAVQIGRPGEGETQKIVNTTLPLIFQPTTGNNEISLTFT